MAAKKVSIRTRSGERVMLNWLYAHRRYQLVSIRTRSGERVMQSSSCRTSGGRGFNPHPLW